MRPRLLRHRHTSHMPVKPAGCCCNKSRRHSRDQGVLALTLSGAVPGCSTLPSRLFMASMASSVEYMVTVPLDSTP